MDNFDALDLAQARKSTTPQHHTWQGWEARCWLDSVTKVELYERYGEVCHRLDLLAARAQAQPERRAECRAQMLPLACEALAIFKVL